ncbi:WXG100 family type VII secretion target [Rhizomonospora bruguierae]|uniref:WXG100 family type VII secretion target n=1 Tax=Rhizomonospora bruguierae TaxID=1581705 RepID=UPI001BCBD424|nr:WXG100 family type VII secretion target [Micromonospora sp. NBRC 107566]
MGAEGQIVYKFHTMSSAAEAIDVAVSTLNGTLSDIERDLRPLEGEAWSSEAQQQYKIRQDRWRNAAAHIAQTLGQIKAAVISASERMSHTDKKAVNYF